MAGDWIKMRPTLLTSPKVNGIARALESSPNVSRALSTSFNGAMSEIVTRNVMRNVTVASLLTVWGAANEHTSDGIFRNADLADIDDMVGIPGFGEAMESVGWAEYDPDEDCVILPNFNEYNTCGRDRTKKNNAERQRRYRQKKKAESNGDSDVTKDVTNNGREEKRREEIYPPNPRAGARERFPMTEAWEPDAKALAAHIRMMNISGVSAHQLTESLGEFRSYWVTQDRNHSESEWTQRFAKELKRASVRAAGENHADSRKTGASSPDFIEEDLDDLENQYGGTVAH